MRCPKRVLAVCLVAIGAAGTAQHPTWAGERVYYVSPAGNDDWAGDTPDVHARGPFATISHAVAAAQKNGIRTIVVEDGTYHDHWPIVIGRGSDGLTIGAAASAHPILSGGTIVTGFAPSEKSAFAAPLHAPPGLDIALNGRRLQPTRSGDFDPSDQVHSGWSIMFAALEGPSKTAFRFKGTDIRSSDDAPGLVVQAVDISGYMDGVQPIARIDGQTVTLSSPLPYALHNGSRYRVLGNPSDLKFPGQFAWRAADNTLLVIPPKTVQGQKLTVVVAGDSPILRIGAANVTIEGLTFEDTSTFAPAVAISDGSRNRIANNRFINVGIGVSTSNTSENAITDNTFSSIGSFGVQLKPISSNNVIARNKMNEIGTDRLFSSGIILSGGNGNRITGNQISDSNRHAIAVIPASATPELAGLNTYIGHNHIRHTMVQTADGGAIYLLGRSMQDLHSTIEGNDIRDVAGVRTDGNGRWHHGSQIFGIYLDDKTSGVTVSKNFLLLKGGEVTPPDTGIDPPTGNIGSAAIFVHGGIKNLIEENIAVLDGPMQFAWITVAPDMIAHFQLNKLNKNRILRNIIYLRQPARSYWRYLTPQFASSDQNIIFGVDPAGGKNGKGFDQSSLWQDPGFVNPSRNDFRLMPTSPARQMGIQGITNSADIQP